MNKIKIVFIGIIIIILLVAIFVITNYKEQEISNPVLEITESLGHNIYANDIKSFDIYNENIQNDVETQIKGLISKENTFENPLIIYNPFGTNKLSLN